MTPDELEQLRRDVAYLKDRSAILDVVNRHARGCDRHDVELLTSTYHDDGVDEHGTARNDGPRFAEFINAVHAMSSRAHTHNITTHTCDIDGDTAHAESYVLVSLLAPDAGSTSVMSGRYLDRLERRDGEWRIAARRSTVDLVVSGSAGLLQHAGFQSQAYPQGTRDRTDPSYARPLDLDAPGGPTW